MFVWGDGVWWWTIFDWTEGNIYINKKQNKKTIPNENNKNESSAIHKIKQTKKTESEIRKVLDKIRPTIKVWCSSKIKQHFGVALETFVEHYPGTDTRASVCVYAMLWWIEKKCSNLKDNSEERHLKL